MFYYNSYPLRKEEIPLSERNRSETIQPSMTVLLRSKLETMLDIQYQTGDFGYMECEPLPPDQSASSIYESFEALNTELTVQICSDTLRISLINQMINVEGMRFLEDIEQGKITAENIPQFFETSTELEKNFAFLWSAFLKRSDLLERLLSIGAELYFCDQNGFSALHLAAFSGCLPSTRFLISKQMEVNMQPNSYTPLHCAAFGNSVETAKILLKNGALISIDTKTPSYEQSLLHCAVQANSLDCVKLFIEEGSDVNSLKPNGTNAIHLAAHLGNAHCLEALLNAPGADPDTRISIPGKESTALHLAADKGYVECVKLLLAKGADSNLKNAWELTALHLAARKSSLECVKLLLEKGNAEPNAKDFYHRTPLIAAIGKSDHALDIVETLVSYGANVNHQDRHGFTALHLASLDGLSRCLEALLHAPDADPNIGICSFVKKSTALHLAAGEGNVECVNLLLAKGADSNLENDWGFTALHLAARKSCLESVNSLLKNGNANINHQDNDGFTALHLAAYYGIPRSVEMLISSGADVTIKTKSGATALSLIIRQTPAAVAMITQKFDAAITLNRSQDIEKMDVELNFNFRELLQHSHPYEISYLHTFVDERRNEILEHPLCSAFLYIKWGRIQMYYLKNLLYYLWFVVFLTGFIFLSGTDNCFDGSKDNNSTIQMQELCQNRSILVDLVRNNSIVMKIQNCYNFSKDNNTTIQMQELCQNRSILVDLVRNNSFVMKMQNCYNFSKDDNTTIEAQELCQNQSILVDLLRNNSIVMKIQNCYNFSKHDNTTIQTQELCEKPEEIYELFWILVCITIPEIFRKLFGMAGYLSVLDYITLQNLLEWCVILSIFFTYDIHMKQKYTFGYHIGVFGVLLGWINLMLMFGQLPVFAVYVAMYTKVLKEVAKLFIAYSCMLVLFTISFCVIFPSSSSFANPIMGFITVLLMMIGEIDLSLLTDNPDEEDSSVILKISTIITFVLFLFFVPITLMNLLIGIAVNDIQGLKKTAQQSKLVQQMKLIYYMESLLFDPKHSTWLKKRLHFMLDPPKPCEEELCEKPFNLGEIELPRAILMAAYEVAEKHEHSEHKISPGCSEDMKFSDNDKSNNAKHVEALTIQIKELKQLQQQASKDINKLLLVISSQQRNNVEK